jgi:glycosyltransferase involved in cell wall biosynthesis
MWGAGHKPVADAHPDMIVVEPGIGYPGGHFARWKVFESYAVLHAYYGLAAVGHADRCDWYDWVIPNYFSLDDFEFRADKDDYLLFLGFRSIGGEGKGIQLAYELARAVKMPLVIAGPGDPTTLPEDVQLDPLITFTGFVGVEERRKLLSRARAVLCPSMFVEPFCGVMAEALLSGTPVISTDWGAFTENNIHGVTGFRCRTFEQFVWAARNVDQIDPRACWAFAAAKFSMEHVGEMYEEFWRAVMAVYTGKPGWYQENPGRKNLDWLIGVDIKVI